MLCPAVVRNKMQRTTTTLNVVSRVCNARLSSVSVALILWSVECTSEMHIDNVGDVKTQRDACFGLPGYCDVERKRDDKKSSPLFSFFCCRILSNFLSFVLRRLPLFSQRRQYSREGSA
jgi:hypothetical protein